MIKLSFCAAGAWLLAATCAFAGDAVGFRETTLDQAGARPLHVAIWYPTKGQGETAVVGENRAFYGFPVTRDAAPVPGGKPLVVLSHGYGGSWRNLGWLAQELAGPSGHDHLRSGSGARGDIVGATA